MDPRARRPAVSRGHTRSFSGGVSRGVSRSCRSLRGWRGRLGLVRGDVPLPSPEADPVSTRPFSPALRRTLALACAAAGLAAANPARAQQTAETTGPGGVTLDMLSVIGAAA